MSNKKNLDAAKRVKVDEFYTRAEDVSAEIMAYWTHNADAFRGKVVLLPCDDPEWSAFTKVFAQSFEQLGLKGLISTSYDKDGGRGKVYRLDGSDLDGDGRVDYHDLRWEYLEGDGDFRSDEVTALRDEADIIVTNPPFSKIRQQFLPWLMESGKQFLYLGPLTQLSYKEVYPLVQQGKLWLGVNNGGKKFILPDGTLKNFGNVVWYTNMDHGRRHEAIKLSDGADVLRYHKYYRGKDQFERYANLPDAIHVKYVLDIPGDYDGVVGVPISFFTKYNPDQFEIVGFRYGNDGKDLRVEGRAKSEFFRVLVRLR